MQPFLKQINESL